MSHWTPAQHQQTLQQAHAFINAHVSLSTPPTDLLATLEDGVILCKFMNALVPGTRVSYDPAPANVFAQMENAASFLAAARSLGLPDSDLFQPSDLTQPLSHHRVLLTLMALGRVAPSSRASSARTLTASVDTPQAGDPIAPPASLKDLLDAFKPPVSHHNLSPFKLGKCIGKGQYASVYMYAHASNLIFSAFNTQTGETVAIKRIPKSGPDASDLGLLMKEVSLLQSITHPCIVKYLGYKEEPEYLNIIMEYMENGSLSTLIKSFGPCSEHLAATYTLRMLKGLVYLHQQNIIHCDLKAANVLTTKDGHARLSDFGVSKRSLGTVRETVGSPYFMAPEVIQSGDVTPASDIWSLGCTVIELVTGSPPYSDLIPVTALFRIVTDEQPPLPMDLSLPLVDFLNKCFAKDPAQRWTASQLSSHPWIKQHLKSEAKIQWNQEVAHRDAPKSILKGKDKHRRWSTQDPPSSHSLDLLESPRPATLDRPQKGHRVRTKTMDMIKHRCRLS